MMKQQIWAHRGSSNRAPENTMAAFRLAMEEGADGIEIDVQFSRDKQVVVIHDEFLSRLTGFPQSVRDLDYADLAKLNAANHWKGGSEQHRIPLLSEVLDLLKGTNMVLNIELKNSIFLQPGLEESVLSLVKERSMEDQIIYSSFNHYSMKYMADMGYGSSCGLLYGDMMVDPWDYAKELGVGAIHPLLTNLQLPDFAKMAAEAGIAVHAWTIDETEYLQMALAMNIDAIITNVPAEALALRNAQ